MTEEDEKYLKFCFSNFNFMNKAQVTFMET